MSDTEKFAFGRNEYESCECPAMAAGFEPASGDGSLTIAEKYDDEVQHLTNGDVFGLIDPETAKEAWMNTVEHFERNSIAGAEIGREIAEELGWDE